ncbi:nucleotidyltransferase [Qipengyuania sp. GH25]|uniref:Nucleotidyltransferase n=1 Tax=Qipengyuania pacifica TaxID=2860199 RepID=A0ABS7JJM7_9SPHN|nr:nucleotidyltransferase [Qipengyuania aerophila]MBX7488732.1 nucleotidyltransferase [Qipengyuania aerophila]
MRKDRFNALFRAHVRDHLSPTPGERDFVSDVYEAVQDVLGARKSLQIGSYPRFTAITPLHDLDVLYILGAWDPAQHDPNEALADLEQALRTTFKNPSRYSVTFARQTHSVTLSFVEAERVVFGVDIVPAYTNGRNEFGGDCYVVPEVVLRPHRERAQLRENVSRGTRDMRWIQSDPRGYITAASNLNTQNGDFRKAVKFAKGWRHSCKEADDNFPLKSFHVEQAITQWVLQNPTSTLFDMVFEFFVRLPDFLRYPQLPDRADPSSNIDAYVAELDERAVRNVIEARDGFLVALEDFEEGDDVAALLACDHRKRVGSAESFLFDQRIPMLTEHDFSIVGEVPQASGFRGFVLDALGLIPVDRKIHFRLGRDAPAADLYKWKVRNDDGAPQPRGEITDHRTLRDPEHTKYRGSHLVECFAILDEVCIGRGRQNVVLGSLRSN